MGGSLSLIVKTFMWWFHFSTCPIQTTIRRLWRDFNSSSGAPQKYHNKVSESDERSVYMCRQDIMSWLFLSASRNETSETKTCCRKGFTRGICNACFRPGTFWFDFRKSDAATLAVQNEFTLLLLPFFPPLFPLWTQIRLPRTMHRLYSARIREETPSRADYFPQNYFRDPRIYYLSSPYLNCSFLPCKLKQACSRADAVEAERAGAVVGNYICGARLLSKSSVSFGKRRGGAFSLFMNCLLGPLTFSWSSVREV